MGVEFNGSNYVLICDSSQQIVPGETLQIKEFPPSLPNGGTLGSRSPTAIAIAINTSPSIH
jgi:hypothetical protein